MNDVPSDVAVNAKREKLQFIFLTAVGFNAAGYIFYLQTYSHLLEGLAHGDNPLFPATHWVASPSFALLLLAVSLLVEACLEIPTGLFADRRGPAFAVRASLFINTVHAILYVISALCVERTIDIGRSNVLIIIGVAEIVLCLGTALQSGALNTWFVQSLKATGHTGPLTTFMGRRRLITNATWMVGGALVLALRDLPLWIPFALSVAFYGIGAAMALIFVSPASPTVGLNGDSEEATSIVNAWREILNTPALRYLLVSHSAFWSLGLTLAYFWQRLIQFFLGEPKEGAMIATALSLTWVLISISRVSASAIASRMDTLLQRGGRRFTYFIGQIANAGPIALLGLLAVASPPHGGVWTVFGAAIALSVSRFGQEIAKPVASAWIHEAIKSERNRTTIESIFEGFSGVGVTVLALVVVLLERFGKADGTASGFLLFATGIIACAVLLIAYFQFRFPPKVAMAITSVDRTK